MAGDPPACGVFKFLAGLAARINANIYYEYGEVVSCCSRNDE